MDYNCEQVRNKIDTLRKKYKKEKGKNDRHRGVRSTWEYFELLDTLWSTTPRCVGIPGAFDSSDSRHTQELQEVNVEIHLEEGEEVDVEEDGEVGGHQPVERSSGTTNVDSNDASGLGVKAQKVKEPKRASLGTFARALGDGWKGMSDTMKYIEKERQMHEDRMSKELRDHEERMFKLRMEEDTKWMDMFMRVQVEMAKALGNRQKGLISTRPRMWWYYPRQVAFWRAIHSGVWSTSSRKNQATFRMYYRMSHEAFNDLKDLVLPHLPCGEMIEFRRQPVQADLALACVLWRFAHGHSSRTVSQLFGLGDSTIRKYTQLIVGVLCGQDMLSRCQIMVPSGTRLAQIITDFEAITGLCNICGAIDGTHIKLARKPVVDLFPAQYISRHGFHSILLQGIVDSKKLFWNVVCNAPGGSHDSNVFKNSQVYRDMKFCEILSEPLIELNRLFIRPYLVGDSAYKPTSFLLKAFKSKARQDLALKNAFDKQIAKGRVKVENAFGILKNRWRILRDLNVSILFAPNVVIACCVLHNYVQLKGEPEPYDAIDPHPNDGDP
ncbi:hypothetical protein L7F22_007895 [Adiantum nelumboides]|nr:hypothetical protein [Adiantum nelumboides]